eukprot:TRINITY_DN131_c1_g1_i3.p1 TRINITY_DN131_c1_g1~~TRINITY_DN131_c1_g1_i3.p1  ORF type:complete len:703 (+),score=139.92 TRINITY_DN131_c1_g1_i3:88-2196(+)
MTRHHYFQLYSVVLELMQLMAAKPGGWVQRRELAQRVLEEPRLWMRIWPTQPTCHRISAMFIFVDKLIKAPDAKLERGQDGKLVLYRLRQVSRDPSVSNSPSSSTSESSDEHCGGDDLHCVATKSRGPPQALCVKRSSEQTGGGAASSHPTAIKRRSTKARSCRNGARSAMEVNLPSPDATMNKLRPRATARTCGAVDGSSSTGSSSTGGEARSAAGEASDSSSSSSGELHSSGAAARAAMRPPVEHCSSSSDGGGATSQSGSDAECPALRTSGSAVKRPGRDRSSSDGGGQVSAAAAAATALGAGSNAKRRGLDGSSSTGGKARRAAGEASDSGSSSGELRSSGAAARAARRPPLEHCSSSSDGSDATSKSGSDDECHALRTSGSAVKRPGRDRSSSDGGGQVSAAAAAASGAGRNAKRRRLHVHERSSSASSPTGGGAGKVDVDAARVGSSGSIRTATKVAQSSRLHSRTNGAVADSVVKASRMSLPAQAAVVKKRKRTPSGPLRATSTAAGGDVAKGKSTHRKRVEVLRDDDALQCLVEERARLRRVADLEHQRAQQAAREAFEARSAAHLAELEQPAGEREAAGFTSPHIRIVFSSSSLPPPPPCGGRNCLYAKLGLSCLTEGINCRMVKQVYHARMLINHPDKAQGLGQKAGAAIADPKVSAYNLNNLKDIVDAHANNMEARAICANWRQNGRIPHV